MRRLLSNSTQPRQAKALVMIRYDGRSAEKRGQSQLLFLIMKSELCHVTLLQPRQNKHHRRSHTCVKGNERPEAGHHEMMNHETSKRQVPLDPRNQPHITCGLLLMDVATMLSQLGCYDTPGQVTPPGRPLTWKTKLFHKINFSFDSRHMILGGKKGIWLIAWHHKRTNRPCHRLMFGSSSGCGIYGHAHARTIGQGGI